MRVIFIYFTGAVRQIMRKQTAELIDKLRQEKIDIYLISDMDDHLSEYTGEHFHALEEFSGFTGGDGKLLVTADGKALLFTDGRYFIQAEKELSGSGIELMRMGEPGVPTVAEWINAHAFSGCVLGFDGRCISYKYGKVLEGIMGKHGKSSKTVSRDICGEIWSDRPAEHCTECWLLDEKYTGKSASVKLSELKSSMSEAHAVAHIIASLDDIAWLLNMRADDIPYNPVFSAFMLITADEARLYIDKRHFSQYQSASGQDTGRPSEENNDKKASDAFDDVHSKTEKKCCESEQLPGKPADTEYLSKLGVSVYQYEQIYEDIRALRGRVLIDTERCSYEIVHLIEENADIADMMNPVTKAKCLKNPTEAANLHIAQHKDSVALTRFMYWFKRRMGLDDIFDSGALKNKASESEPTETAGITEWDCVERLHELRAEQEGFIEESFSTISAYGANAAMAHYAPSPLSERAVLIEPHGLYLVDSGGQYPEGTTDVTRTWSCGPVTDEEATSFTLTVMANLRLADEKFPEGTSGLVIDGAARDVFWRRGLNFNHGTGHGVGFCLNVHEAPVGIRYRTASIEGAYPMLEGMYVSDEPGMYAAGKYGIRTENLLLVRHDYTNEYGRFMSFEVMNFCPIDKSCLNFSIMEKHDIELLNAYHERVYKELKDDMNEEERKWLRKMCEAVL